MLLQTYAIYIYIYLLRCTFVGDLPYCLNWAVDEGAKKLVWLG